MSKSIPASKLSMFLRTSSTSFMMCAFNAGGRESSDLMSSTSSFRKAVRFFARSSFNSYRMENERSAIVCKLRIDAGDNVSSCFGCVLKYRREPSLYASANDFQRLSQIAGSCCSTVSNRRTPDALRPATRRSVRAIASNAEQAESSKPSIRGSTLKNFNRYSAGFTMTPNQLKEQAHA